MIYIFKKYVAFLYMFYIDNLINITCFENLNGVKNICNDCLYNFKKLLFYYKLIFDYKYENFSLRKLFNNIL